MPARASAADAADAAGENASSTSGWSIKEAAGLRMTEWGDARFTALAAWPVVRQWQVNVRGVLVFLQEVARTSQADVHASVMVAFGSHAAALGAC